MVEHFNNFCARLFTMYSECMCHNIDVFGKERGPIMCKYVKEILDNSICDKSKMNDKESKIE